MTGPPPYDITEGLIERAVQARTRELAEAQEAGQHYWMGMLGYRVTPPFTEARHIHLDTENLRTDLEIACMICGEIDLDNADQPCPGPR